MNRVAVAHSAGSYVVHVGASMEDALTGSIEAMGGQAVVIADRTVAQMHPDLLPKMPRLTFAAGESSKNRNTWLQLTDQLLAMHPDRRTVVVALGGGVTTDLAGFVAATTLRGLRWVAVPTTTLAMCDAAVGGKTGVDTNTGKNLVGSFHQPQSVWCDVELLTTLAEGQFRSGLAETVKHAAIADAELWHWLEENAVRILERGNPTLIELVTRSVAIKAAVVSADERESGRRAILNVGHTVAHAIEYATAFGVPHGDAVAIGMVTEARAGEALGITTPGTATAMASLLQRFDLPVTAPDGLDLAAFRAGLRADKKNQGEHVHVAVIASLGVAHGSDSEGWTHSVEPDLLVRALAS